MIFTSAILSRVPGVIHGFGTREEPIPRAIEELWKRSRPSWKQIHTAVSCEVIQPSQACGETDAPFTFQKDLPIAVVTADCVPILLARKTGGAVAAVHAGWRGTRARILRELWKVLAERGEKPSDWVAAVGPSIGPCCYEVSVELAQEFQNEFGARALAAPRMLDLGLVNRSELLDIGLAEVDLIRACTRCSGTPESPLFHSYRREGGGTRQYSMIVAN